MWNKDRVYGMYRQVSGITPKTYVTGPDFDKVENDYRCARDAALMMIKHIEEVKTYEHGGPTYKAILEGIAKAKGKTKAEADEDLSDNMYNVGANVFESLASKTSDPKVKDAATQIKNNYVVMSKKKHEMNKKLSELLVKVKQLKKESLNIDNERTKMKNAQFDAERAFESAKKKFNEEDARKREDVVKIADEFNVLKEKNEKMMKDYTKDAKHLEILGGLNDIYKQYYKESTSELK